MSKQELPIEVAEIDRIEVHDVYFAKTSEHQILQQFAAYASRANHQHFCLFSFVSLGALPSSGANGGALRELELTVVICDQAKDFRSIEVCSFFQHEDQVLDAGAPTPFSRSSECEFCGPTSFTIVLSGTPSDWRLKRSRCMISTVDDSAQQGDQGVGVDEVEETKVEV